MNRVDLKITVVGDSLVGKSSLLRSYLEHYFSKEDSGTEEQLQSENYFIKNTTLDGVHYKLHLWDTSSRLEPRTVRTLIYPKTDCFIICYAASNSATFSSISKIWIPEIRRSCANANMIVVGTKLDLKNCYGAARVPDTVLESFILRYKVDAVVECSSRTLEGVNQVFKEATNAAFRHKNNLCVIQ